MSKLTDAELDAKLEAVSARVKARNAERDKHGKPPQLARVSDQIRAAFDVADQPIEVRRDGTQSSGIWVERDGKTVRGVRPKWVDWQSVRGDQMGSAEGLEVGRKNREGAKK